MLLFAIYSPSNEVATRCGCGATLLITHRPLEGTPKTGIYDSNYILGEGAPNGIIICPRTGFLFIYSTVCIGRGWLDTVATRDGYLTEEQPAQLSIVNTPERGAVHRVLHPLVRARMVMTSPPPMMLMMENRIEMNLLLFLRTLAGSSSIDPRFHGDLQPLVTCLSPSPQSSWEVRLGSQQVVLIGCYGQASTAPLPLQRLWIILWPPSLHQRPQENSSIFTGIFSLSNNRISPCILSRRTVNFPNRSQNKSLSPGHLSASVPKKWFLGQLKDKKQPY